MTRGKPIIAHRGAHSLWVRENTLAAFERAILVGADMVEFDVRKLTDGALVVFHDSEIDHQLLQGMNAGALREYAADSGIAIPTLAQVLELCSGRIGMLIELKDQGCEAALVRALYVARCSVNDCIAISFDEETLARLLAEKPGMHTGLLVESVSLEDAAAKQRDVHADYLAPAMQMLDDVSLKCAQNLGLRLLPWTVNDEDDLRRLLRSDAVAGVITDEPVRALGLRRVW